MKKLIATLSLAVCAVPALFAWDVEHDEVAQLTGEFLPKEVKATFDFNDFAILQANCHFPDMTEWPCENGKRRFHTLEELAARVGEDNARTFAGLGYTNSNWFHTPKGRAALMGMLARAFGKGDHASAAFCVSVLTHAVSDEGALNHPPLLGFFRYSNLPGIDFTMRKVEEGAKNVFGFRSDGHVVHLVRERMKGYVPKSPAGSFEEAMLSMGVDVAVNDCAFTGEIEGAIAFAPQPEAERALVDLVHRQVRVDVLDAPVARRGVARGGLRPGIPRPRRRSRAQGRSAAAVGLRGHLRRVAQSRRGEGHGRHRVRCLRARVRGAFFPGTHPFRRRRAHAPGERIRRQGSGVLGGGEGIPRSV